MTGGSTSAAKVEPPAPAALIDAAFQHHRAGRLPAAAQFYRRALVTAPGHEKTLLLFGMLQAGAGYGGTLLERFLRLGEGGPAERGAALFELARLRQSAFDDAAALALFAESDRLAPGLAATHRGLALSLQRSGRAHDALAAIDRALTLEPAFAPAHFNHGAILESLNDAGPAIGSFQRAALLAPEWDEAWSRLGDLWRKAGAQGPAEAAFRRSIAAEPGNAETCFRLSSLLERQGRLAEARDCAIEAGRRHGVRRHPCRGGKPVARVLLIGGAGSCNLPPEFLFPSDRYELVSTYLLPPDVPESDPGALTQKLPPFDVAFNAIADLDRGADFFPQAKQVCQLLRQPVLNPPDFRLERTRRDRIADFLADTPGLIVPPTRRLTRRDLAELAVAPERPMLVRPAGAHGGDDLERIDGGEALAVYLARNEAELFYVSDYVDYASEDGYFRKYRFIAVDREIYPYHLAIGRHWLLHYISSDMVESAAFRRDEERFLADWRSTLPAAAAQALDTIAVSLDLDYAGVDCAVARDGRLVLFEANPCMLVHLRDPQEIFPYKHRYVPRIVDAVERMVRRKRLLTEGHSSA
jgi:Tfp pilus assembly protein PilF